MNKFYYLGGLEIKELNTVKNFDYIKTKVNKNVKEKKKDIAPPYGYELKGNKFKMTQAYIDELAAAQVVTEYDQLIQDTLRQIAIDVIEA